MIICVCKGISDKEIRKCVSDGWDFDRLQFDLGVGLQCGSCQDCARKIVSETPNVSSENTLNL